MRSGLGLGRRHQQHFLPTLFRNSLCYLSSNIQKLAQGRRKKHSNRPETGRLASMAVGLLLSFLSYPQGLKVLHYLRMMLSKWSQTSYSTSKQHTEHLSRRTLLEVCQVVDGGEIFTCLPGALHRVVGHGCPDLRIMTTESRWMVLQLSAAFLFLFTILWHT